MGKAYSLDLRERIAAHVAAGGSRRSAARRFGVSPATAVRVAAQAQAGSMAPKKIGRPPGRGKLAAHGAWLEAKVAAAPDLTLAELAAALQAEKGVRVHPTSIHRALQALDITVKKSL